MKKYLLYLLMAFAAISFTACEDDAEPMGKSIRADVPELNFEGQNGAEQTVSILSDGDWVASAPEWITVTPNYGTGNMTVKIKVADNLDTDGTLAAERKGSVTFSVLESAATIAIVQAGDPAKKPVEPAKITIAEFNAAAEDDNVYYELTGTITNIKNTQYGNFDIVDATGSVYVYGLLDGKGGDKYDTMAEKGLSEGDLITLRGYRGSYNGLIEVMGGYYVSHVASLVSATPAEVELPIGGGNFEIALVYKGESFEVAINDEAKTWLNMGAIRPDGDTTRISFSAGANAGGLREATISFTSSKGDVSSTVTTAVKQEGSIVDISIADFLTKEDGPALYRLTGKIKSIVKEEYGNIYLEDATGEVYVYGVTATAVEKNDKSFASLGLKVGDILTIVGTKSSYKETPQAGYNNVPAYYESHVSYTESTVADFLAASTGDAYYKLTGTVKNLSNGTYNNAEIYGNFDLVDEAGTSVYVYGLTKAPVAKNDKSFASLGIKEGDKVTLIGKRAEYKGTAQVASAYYISHEAGQTGGDGDGEATGGYSWTLENGAFGTVDAFKSSVTAGTPALTWATAITWGANGGYIGFDTNDSARGLQLGSGSKPATAFSLETTATGITVSSIVINGSIASSGTAKVSVYVNDAKVGETVTLTTTATDYTFTLGSAVKDAKVKIAYENTQKAMYLKSVTLK